MFPSDKNSLLTGNDPEACNMSSCSESAEFQKVAAKSDISPYNMLHKRKRMKLSNKVKIKPHMKLKTSQFRKRSRVSAMEYGYASEDNETRSNVDPREAMAILEDICKSIDSSLKCKAQKNNLTEGNVKTILKHVVSNEHVISMVRNTLLAETEDHPELQEAVYVPKMTRSKVKQLKGMYEHESAEGVKNTPKIDAVSPSPKTSLPEVVDDLNEERPLVIAEPLKNATHELGNQVSEIARRTHSKLPLNDVQLEELESAFVAPDISEDLYDTECNDDDWMKFLNDLAKPAGLNVPENEPDEDNGEDDPDYNFLAEEANTSHEEMEDFQWDYRSGKALRESKKELRDLTAEILEFAEPGCSNFGKEQLHGEEREMGSLSPCISWSLSEDHFFDTENCLELLSQNMTQGQKSQLQEQMRMHVQLLCQTYLLSVDRPLHAECGNHAKLMLEELEHFSNHELPEGKESFFKAHNLPGAVKILKSVRPANHFKNSKIKEKVKTVKTKFGIQSVRIKVLMATNKTFIYPDLLPHSGFQTHLNAKNKNIFIPVEDNLLALGLENFSSFSPTERRNNYISRYLLPTKTPSQIRVRIKETRSTRADPDNPIKYYFQHKKITPFPRNTRPFDPQNVKFPSEAPLEILPSWMRALIRKHPTLKPIENTCPQPQVHHSTCNSKPCNSSLLKRKRSNSPDGFIAKFGFERKHGILNKHVVKRPMNCIGESSSESSDEQKKSSAYSRSAECEVWKPNKSSVYSQKTRKKGVLQNFQNENLPPKKRATWQTSTKAPKLKHNSIEEKLPSDMLISDNEVQLRAGACTKGALKKAEDNLFHDKNISQGCSNSEESSACQSSKDQVESNESSFTENYIMRVVQALKEKPEKLQRFLQTLCSYEESSESYDQLYEKMKDILSGHPELLEDFALFEPDEEPNG